MRNTLKTSLAAMSFMVMTLSAIAQDNRPAQADASLAVPEINTRPGAKYQERNLDYGMTIGIEQTPKGRIWCCWVGGGDDERAYFLLSYSDDGGWTWSKTKTVIDPHDKSSARLGEQSPAPYGRTRKVAFGCSLTNR